MGPIVSAVFDEELEARRYAMGNHEDVFEVAFGQTVRGAIG